VPDTVRLIKVKVVQPRAEGNPYLPASDDVVEMDAAVATSLAASGLVEIVQNKTNAKTATAEEKE
jgi:hypothetical protein